MPAALRACLEMLSFDPRSSGGKRRRNLNKHLGRLKLAILFSLTLTLEVSAEPVAQTARTWRLIGPWSLDCSLSPDRNKGTVLAYVIASGNRLVHRRNFGDITDESEGVTAEVSGDCMLNLRVFFPILNQTHEYVLIKK